jgi:hypothetical protein
MANFYQKQSSSQLNLVNSILYTGNTTTTFSNRFGAQTRQIRVATNIAGGAYLLTGDSSSATVASTTGMYIAANNFPEYFGVVPGQIAAINSTSTTTGQVSICEMI